MKIISHPNSLTFSRLLGYENANKKEKYCGQSMNKLLLELTVTYPTSACSYWPIYTFSGTAFSHSSPFFCRSCSQKYLLCSLFLHLVDTSAKGSQGLTSGLNKIKINNIRGIRFWELKPFGETRGLIPGLG